VAVSARVRDGEGWRDGEPAFYQLFSKGKQVGDEVGSCVIASITPELLANCTLVIRLPGRQHHRPVRRHLRSNPEAAGVDRRHQHLWQRGR
jgi:hypothetical protein